MTTLKNCFTRRAAMNGLWCLRARQGEAQLAYLPCFARASAETHCAQATRPGLRPRTMESYFNWKYAVPTTFELMTKPALYCPAPTAFASRLYRYLQPAMRKLAPESAAIE